MNAMLLGPLVALLLIPLALVMGQESPPAQLPYVVILGIAQDAGYPQAGCQRECCRRAWADPELRRSATCIAVVDPVSDQRWLFDCTPDFRDQLHQLLATAPARDQPLLEGIFLTHAHIGHYTGLVHLGREVMGARQVPVFAMPRLTQFLNTNGPWNLLVQGEHIELIPMAAERAVKLNDRISVTPIPVPHRGEYSETVAFQITGPRHSVLYLPDIDKWELWEREIEDEIRQVDVALLDATFYDGNELPDRDLSNIPHPFIIDSMNRFSSLSAEHRAKVRFIHLNHSNPALDPDSAATQSIRRAGLSIAEQGERIEL